MLSQTTTVQGIPTDMFKLTFIMGKRLHTITNPSFWTLYALRKVTPNSRLWDKQGALVW